MVGDTSGGKSQIVQRFVFDRFEEGESRVTIGAEFTGKQATLKDKTKIKLQLWDTAGTEQHRAIVKSYFRGALGVFLVCDITQLSTFYGLTYWLEQVKEICGPDTVIALLANKCDIMFEDPQSRQVLREQLLLFARDNGLVYLGECSAKADINIKNTFQDVTERIYTIQKKLGAQGEKGLKGLKLKDEDTAQNYENRCCY